MSLFREMSGVLLAGCLVAAGCSGGEVAGPGDLAGPSSSVTAPSSTPTTVAVEPAGNDEELVELWSAVFGAVGRPQAESDAVLAELTDRLSDDAAAAAAAIARAMPEGNAPEFVSDPEIVDAVDGGVEITDCVVFDREFGASNSVKFVGTAVSGSDGWELTNVEPFDVDCIPASMNEAILRDYARYVEVYESVVNPMTPDSPLIDEVFSKSNAEAVREDLASWKAKSWIFVMDDHEHHPEVAQVLGPGKIKILDCVVVGPNDGVYLSDNTPVAEYPVPGKEVRDLEELIMVVREGRWALDSVGNITADTDCEFAPTEAGLEIVGGVES